MSPKQPAAAFLIVVSMAATCVAGCSCEYWCPDRLCARRSILWFGAPLDEPGHYVIRGTPLPSGELIECEVDLGGAEPPAVEACDPVGLVWAEPDGGASALAGLRLVGQLDTVDLRIERDGVLTYEGRATLDHVEIGLDPRCGQPDCDVHVLRAQ